MKNNTKLLLLIVVITVAASFFASAYPDGLEWVAEKLGFIETAQESSSVMTDYACPFIKFGGLSTVVAGLVGIGIILTLTFISTFYQKSQKML